MFMSPPDLRQPPLPPDVHVVLDGQSVGPLDEEALRGMVAEGRIGPATLAWHPALDSWAEIASLPEIVWLLAPPAAPVAAPAVGVADLGQRLVAGSIDLAVWLILVGLLSIPFDLEPAFLGASTDPVLARRFDLLAQGTAAVYYLALMSRLGGGATLGYRLLGLRLVAARDLRPPGVLRTLVWYIVTYVRLVGWLTYFVDPRRRMLHNIVSGTLVIQARSDGR